MQVSFLLDENIAAPLADKLDKAGHDVARVVDVNELGESADDTMIRRYAVQEGHLIVTSDDDFVRMPADDRLAVIRERNEWGMSHTDQSPEPLTYRCCQELHRTILGGNVAVCYPFYGSLAARSNLHLTLGKALFPWHRCI